MKIAIAIVSHDMCPVLFAHRLAVLTAFTAKAMPPDLEFTVNLISGTYVHSARQEILESMLSHGVTHILWVDSDMTFPKDALCRLLMHKQDVVGINYSKRNMGEAEFVAFKKLDWNFKGPAERLQTRTDSTGLEEVETMGMGLVLMRTRCLKDLPNLDEEPWFHFEWIKGRREQVGEDTYFFRHLRRAGVRLFVDQDLSKECGHLGQFEYLCEHAEMNADMNRELAEAAEAVTA